MGDRGRASCAELATVGPGGISSISRPEPPKDLTDEQQFEWRAVVNRLPVDHFPRETHGMLVQYCRHIVSARRVAQLIEQHCDSKEFSVDEYDRLLKMQEREGRAISSLATRMRLSQQSLHDPKKKRPIETKKPWAG